MALGPPQPIGFSGTGRTRAQETDHLPQVDGLPHAGGDGQVHSAPDDAYVQGTGAEAAPTEARVETPPLWGAEQPEGPVRACTAQAFRVYESALIPAVDRLQAARHRVPGAGDTHPAEERVTAVIGQLSSLPPFPPLSASASLPERYAALEAAAAAASVVQGAARVLGWLDVRDERVRQGADRAAQISAGVDLPALFEDALSADDVVGAMGVARTGRASPDKQVRHAGCAWDLFLSLREQLRACRGEGVLTTLFLRSLAEDDPMSGPSGRLLHELDAKPPPEGLTLQEILRRHFAGEPGVELLLGGEIDPRPVRSWTEVVETGRVLLQPAVAAAEAVPPQARAILKELTDWEERIEYLEPKFELQARARQHSLVETSRELQVAREEHARMERMRDACPELVAALYVMESVRTDVLRRSRVSSEAASLASTALVTLPPADPDARTFALRAPLAEAIQLLGGPLVTGINILEIGPGLGESGPTQRALRLPDHTATFAAQVRALMHELGLYQQWFLGPMGDYVAALFRETQSDGKAPQKVLEPDPDHPGHRKTIIRSSGRYIAPRAGQLFPAGTKAWRTEIHSVGATVLTDSARMLLAYFEAEPHLAFTLGSSGAAATVAGS